MTTSRKLIAELAMTSTKGTWDSRRGEFVLHAPTIHPNDGLGRRLEVCVTANNLTAYVKLPWPVRLALLYDVGACVQDAVAVRDDYIIFSASYASTMGGVQIFVTRAPFDERVRKWKG